MKKAVLSLLPALATPCKAAPAKIGLLAVGRRGCASVLKHFCTFRKLNDPKLALEIKIFQIPPPNLTKNIFCIFFRLNHPKGAGGDQS